MRFRTAIPADREAIASLHISLGQRVYAGILPDPYLTDVMPREKTALWEQRLALGPDPERLSVTVAEDASGLAGFACFLFDEETAFGTYLHNLYVSPEHQRRGVARGLLAAAIDGFSPERLERPVSLLVFRENHPARRVYERLRGRVVEEIERATPAGPAIGLLRFQWPTARRCGRSSRPTHPPTSSSTHRLPTLSLSAPMLH